MSSQRRRLTGVRLKQTCLLTLLTLLLSTSYLEHSEAARSQPSVEAPSRVVVAKVERKTGAGKQAALVGGVCRRKQFPPRLDGRCSFTCPRNSCVKPGRACVDDLGDCACEKGFVMDPQQRVCVIDTSTCVRVAPGKRAPGCHFTCPAHSCIKPGHGCVDGIEDCACEEGYTMSLETSKCERGVAPRSVVTSSGPTVEYGKQYSYEPATAPAPVSHLTTLHQPGVSVRTPIRIPPRSASDPTVVGQDLGTYHDPQDEVLDTAVQLLQLGVKLSVLFAVARGALQLYTAYWEDGKLWAKLRNSCHHSRWSPSNRAVAPLSPASKCRVPLGLDSVHHVS